MADVFLVSVIPTEVEGSFLHCGYPHLCDYAEETP